MQINFVVLSIFLFRNTFPMHNLASNFILNFLQRTKYHFLKNCTLCKRQTKALLRNDTTISIKNVLYQQLADSLIYNAVTGYFMSTMLCFLIYTYTLGCSKQIGGSGVTVVIANDDSVYTFLVHMENIYSKTYNFL